MIEITDSAARVINRQVAKNPQPGGGLRVAVKAGGCSGFSYQFDWDASARDKWSCARCLPSSPLCKNHGC